MLVSDGKRRARHRKRGYEHRPKNARSGGGVASRGRGVDVGRRGERRGAMWEVVVGVPVGEGVKKKKRVRQVCRCEPGPQPVGVEGEVGRRQWVGFDGERKGKESNAGVSITGLGARA